MTARANSGRAARTPAARRAAAGIAAPFEPMVFSRRDAQAEAARADETRLGLFEVDGTVYTVPADIPTGRRLELLLVAGNLETEALKSSYLVRELAGPRALQALLTDADYREADLLKLGANLSKLVFGALEAASGN